MTAVLLRAGISRNWYFGRHHRRRVVGHEGGNTAAQSLREKLSRYTGRLEEDLPGEDGDPLPLDKVFER